MKPNAIQIISGSLVVIQQTGVLIQGPSGSGKSDTVLELVEKGHQLVADDAICISAIENQLSGSSPELGFEFIHIIGLGVINIREIFGQNALAKQSNIDLLIKINPQITELTELDAFSTENFFGKNLPMLEIPNCTQRHLSMLIEVAVKSFLLRKKGYNASHEFINKQRDLMSK